MFIAVLGWLFLSSPDGWSRLLLDGDTGWHIRTGDFILDHRQIPYRDIFSFSKPGEPWFAWEWGADVLFATLVRLAGLKGLVLFCGALIALYVTFVLRWSVGVGANALIALALTLLAMGASTVHYLARPHLFTLMLLPLALYLLERGRHLWVLVPLMVLWTNLHGGFAGFLACFGLWVLGHPSFRLAFWFSLCSLSTLINPYGYHLHQHMWSYLQSDWIREVVLEFRSPSFRTENIFQYEFLLVLGLMAAASCLTRRRYGHCLWILFWAHQSLSSARHITIYVSVAVPVIAVELTALWDRFLQSQLSTSTPMILNRIAADLAPQFRRISVIAFAAVALLGIIPQQWPSDFPKFRFPVAAVDRYSDRIRSARLLTMDQWADYLIYRFHPSVKVFFDGRSDFYGQTIGDDYIRVSAGHASWRSILDRHQFNLILIPPDWALASLLKLDPAWSLISEDSTALLFTRLSPPRIASAENPSSSLMKSSNPAELSKGALTNMAPEASNARPESPLSKAERL
ncbi:MAG: hypothetical protein IT168_29565 [Bryobacterales bacterium]|nr:hypothetical protein [Bryobacterales bacterium]